MADFFRLKTFEFNANNAIKKFGLEEDGRVQQYIDSECLRLSNEKAPYDQHNLIESGINSTKIGSGRLEYRTPYARRLYYHDEYSFSKEKNVEAGSYWFERMKQQYKDQILKGAQKIAGGQS